MSVVGNANGISGPRPKREAPGAAPPPPKNLKKQEGADDTLSVTSTAQHIDDMREALKDVPSVRDSKVEAIRSQIEAGTYRIDSRGAAEGLLREFTRHRGI